MSVYDTMVAGLSGAGLILLGAITTHGSSEYHLNANQMQQKLTQNAESALSAAGVQWAAVRFLGQSATIIGTAPDQAAAETARQIVLTSSGKGGLLWGGVVEVDYVYVAPTPDPAPIVEVELEEPTEVVGTEDTDMLENGESVEVTTPAETGAVVQAGSE